VRIAVAEMANAIREISIERGYDPSDFVLFPFGGAGAMHAAEIAHEIGIREIVVPILPGNLSALGLLASDQRYERVQSFTSRLSSFDERAFASMLGEHVRLEREALAARGFDAASMRFEHAVDMRYVRQAFELTVELPATGERNAQALRKAFLDAYARHFGRADPQAETEVVNVRTSAIGLTPHPELPAVPRATTRLQEAVIGRRTLIAAGVASSATIYERERLPVGAVFEGPAIVEEDGATTVVPPGWRGQRDDKGNLRLAAQ
jgi:N-methylhydantoinase A